MQTGVVGDDCLFVHDHKKSVNVYNYDSKDGHRSAKTVDAAVGYQASQSSQTFILMKNQAIHIDGLVNHLLCPKQCCLNGVQISEVPKFLAETPSETNHGLELVNPFDAAHQLFITHKLSGVINYIDVYSPIIAEYKMKRFQRFISLWRSHLWTHQQMNIQ